jgi:hypothetical protein
MSEIDLVPGTDPVCTPPELSSETVLAIETSAPIARHQAQGAKIAEIESAIDGATDNGMFPLVAYGLDRDNQPDHILLLTSSIPDMVLAWDLLDRFLGPDYQFSGYVPWSRLEAFARNHRFIVRPHPLKVPHFVATEKSDFELFTNIARDHSASRWHKKAFGLVDICGFSKATIEQQLAYRTSLALALSQSAGRVYKLYQKDYFPGRAAFHSTPTGDGFYFWHHWPGAANDEAVFMLLMYVMVQTEAMRRAGISNMRLKGAFAIGEAYTFGVRDLSNPSDALTQDAIGPALNGLTRLMTEASPGQILVGDFQRPGRNEGDPPLTPGKLIEKAARELLPTELGPRDPVRPQHVNLRFEPTDRLRVADKHDYLHYCYNLVGEAPNRFKGKDVEIFQIGVPPTDATDISEFVFAERS